MTEERIQGLRTEIRAEGISSRLGGATQRMLFGTERSKHHRNVILCGGTGSI